ncbi:hypothetical protein V498_10063, partial [Pseudogymnoascus sp. VKM F-4517 (FW-2822)]
RLDDVDERTIWSRWCISRTKCLEDQAVQARHFENRVEQRGSDTGEDTEAGDVGGVEGELDIEALEGCGAVDKGPVHVDSNTGDAGEGLAVRGAEGIEGGGGDLGGAVAAVEGAVEEEADFRDEEGACYDEGTEEVVNRVGLESED